MTISWLCDTIAREEKSTAYPSLHFVSRTSSQGKKKGRKSDLFEKYYWKNTGLIYYYADFSTPVQRPSFFVVTRVDRLRFAKGSGVDALS